MDLLLLTDRELHEEFVIRNQLYLQGLVEIPAKSHDSFIQVRDRMSAVLDELLRRRNEHMKSLN